LEKIMHAEHNTSPEFDKWLDVALHTRLEEPRAGLEDRVLERIRAREPEKTFVWWPAIAVVAAALAVSTALVLLRPVKESPQKSASVQPPQTVLQSSPPRLPQVASVTRIPARHITKAHSTAVRRFVAHEQQPQPRLASFPSATPATQQERMLVMLAARRGSYEIARDTPNLVPLKDLQIRELAVPVLDGTPPDVTSK
jgi:hypothetical protein